MLESAVTEETEQPPIAGPTYEEMLATIDKVNKQFEPLLKMSKQFETTNKRFDQLEEIIKTNKKPRF